MKRHIALLIFIILWNIGQFFLLNTNDTVSPVILIWYGFSFGLVMMFYNRSFSKKNFYNMYELNNKILKKNYELIKLIQVTDKLNEEIVKHNINLLDEIILLKTKEFN